MSSNPSSDDTVRMDRLNWIDVEERIGSSTLFLPAGSIEQHGPHLPLSTDVSIATHLGIEAARRVNGLVAPALNYGYRSQAKSGGGQAFTGTTNLTGETYQNLVYDVVSELVQDGAEEVVVVPGHGENEFFLREGIDLHLDDGGAGQFMIANWWDLLSSEVVGDVFEEVPGGFPGWNAEHAGIIETSLMQYFCPEQVDEEAIVDVDAPRAPPYDLKPAPDDFIPETGAFYKASYASAAIGERVVSDVVDALVDGIEYEWR